MAAKTKPKPAEEQEQSSRVSEFHGFSFGYGSGRGVERRQEVRYCCNDVAEACVLEGGVKHDDPRFHVTVLEISRSGLRLELNQRVEQGAHMEVILPGQVCIRGELRYCSPAGSNFHGGILIHEVVYPQPVANHIDEQQLRLYLAGRGLTLPEVLGVEDHLTRCPECGLRFRAHVSPEPANSSVSPTSR